MQSTPTRAERRKAWWTAAVAGMASYLDAGAIVTTGTALTLFQDELGISPAQFGQLSALLTGNDRRRRTGGRQSFRPLRP